MNNLSEKDIDTQIATDPDVAPALTPEWLERALLVTPVEKELVSIRLDLDVLEHFRAQGRGYQTRINGILRTVMEHEKKPA